MKTKYSTSTKASHNNLFGQKKDPKQELVNEISNYQTQSANKITGHGSLISKRSNNRYNNQAIDSSILYQAIGVKTG